MQSFIDDKAMLQIIVDCNITRLQFAMDCLHYNCILKQKSIKKENVQKVSEKLILSFCLYCLSKDLVNLRMDLQTFPETPLVSFSKKKQTKKMYQFNLSERVLKWMSDSQVNHTFFLPKPFLCSILLSSLTYQFLISGCECSFWHFILYFSLLSRWHLSSLLQAGTGCPF